jgi:outer membrane scaffolding protein for murein synthesis (MipA/OmpV family)
MPIWRSWKQATLYVHVAGAALIAPALFCAPATAMPESVTLGAAAIVKPKYEGSNQHEVIPIPIIIPKFAETPDDDSAVTQVRKRVNFRGLDDIRVRLLGGERLQVGAVTGYITKRDQDDGDLLRGLGNIDGGMVLGTYSALSLGTFTFDAAILEKITGDDAGPEFRFGVETNRRVSERVELGVRLGTTLASQDYMQTYFGVSPAQSRSSLARLPAYSPDAGVKDVFVAVGASFDLSDRWLLKAGGRYGRLLGEAADSPVIETDNQVSGTIGLGYRFDWRR